MNPADVIILALLALAVIFALRQIKKKKGGCSCGSTDCGGNCAACKSTCSKRKE